MKYLIDYDTDSVILECSTHSKFKLNRKYWYRDADSDSLRLAIVRNLKQYADQEPMTLESCILWTGNNYILNLKPAFIIGKPME